MPRERRAAAEPASIAAMSKVLRIASIASITLAVACTPNKKPEEKPKVAQSPVRQAPPPQLEPPPAEPHAPDPTPQPTLEPAAKTSQWWCLCYQRNGAEGPLPVTACREQESQCRKLEQRVAKGNEEIVAGSLMQACRSVTGTHPSDVAGTPEQWQPSALPGAWVSEGACLLVEAVEVVEPAAPTEPVEPTDTFEFMRSELIGDLAIDQSSAQVRKRFGEPDTMGAIEEMGATGDFEQTWEFADGLTLIMRSTTRSGPQSIGG